MKKIKLYEEFTNENLSMNAVTINITVGAGQDVIQNFMDDNNIDSKKLLAYVIKNKDNKERYDVRDYITGTGLGANKKLRDKFIKKFK
jgi:hypothetical protein